MLPSKAKQAVRHLVTQKRPGFLVGQPGIGKSDIVRQVADELGIGFIDMRLSLYDPTDLKGFPFPNRKTGRTEWLPLGTMPFEGEGILVLDELPNAPQSVLNAAYQLMLDRGIGEYKLPEGWAIMAAGNREGDRSGVNRMPSALISRLVYLPLETNVDEFALYAVPAGVKPDVLAYLYFKNSELNTFTPDTATQPYACPRTWMFVSNNIIEHGLPADIERELLVGTIGEGATHGFVAFRRMANELPTVEEILKSPKKARLPDQNNIGAMYSISTTLALNAVPKNFGDMLTYIERLPKEFHIMFVRDAGRRNNALSETEAFSHFIDKNRKLLMPSS